MMAYNKNDPETIQRMFGSIANQYDRTNAVLSFQMHRYWNEQLVKKVIKSSDSEILLDLCCGTGEIAFSYLKSSKLSREAYLVDFCDEMLNCAKSKAYKLPLSHHKIHYIQADVQKLPLADLSADCATIAYGIRNVKNPAKCISEVYRILKPGSNFGILELTKPKNRILRMGHSFYLKTILPILGKALTSNQQAYQYLCNSIHTFIEPKDLQFLLLQAGFKEVEINPMCGGIATIISAKKF